MFEERFVKDLKFRKHDVDGGSGFLEIVGKVKAEMKRRSRNRYMYDACRRSCMELIEGGFVEAFEETLCVVNRRHSEASRDRQRNLREDFDQMNAFVRMLKKSEDAERTGSVEASFRARMKLANRLMGEKGYQWLAEYVYKTCRRVLEEGNVSDAGLELEVLNMLALLEERRDNVDVALMYMERALKVASENPVEGQDEEMQELNRNLIRIYQQMGVKYLEEESDEVSIKKSKCVLYARKAAKLAKSSGSDLKIQATCYALLGRAMLKFNDTQRAFKNFKSYLKLSEECNDPYGTCNAYFALSEIYNRTGDLEGSREAAFKCQELAKKNAFLIPGVFSSIRVGQLETARRCFTEAHRHFEDAYRVLLFSEHDSRPLHRLCRVMCGIGRAHLGMGDLVANLQAQSSNLGLPHRASQEDIHAGEEGGPEEQRMDFIRRLVEEELELGSRQPE